jgi:hypothetical protein
MFTFKGLAEFIGFLVFYDLVLKESIIKPLVVEFTQSKVRRYLPAFMNYLDGQVYESVVSNDATALDKIPKFRFSDLSESEHKLLLKLSIEKYDPIVFLEKLNQQIKNDEFIRSKL